MNLFLIYVDTVHSSNRCKRQRTAVEAGGSPPAVKQHNKKALPTYTIPAEVSLLRRAGPYLIG